MSIEISDMIAFVDKLKIIEINEEIACNSVKLKNLPEDCVSCFGEVFGGDITVSKVHGV